jgi:hypothetical protein
MLWDVPLLTLVHSTESRLLVWNFALTGPGMLHLIWMTFRLIYLLGPCFWYTVVCWS